MLLGKYVNRFYLKYAFFFLLGIIALVAVDFIQLLIPEYLGKLVDLLSDSSSLDFSQINKLTLYVVFVAIGIFAGRVIWRYAIFYASSNIEASLREQMFQKAERLSLDFYYQNKVGTITAWFTNDLETVEEFFGWGTIMLVDAFFMSVLVIYKMFSLEFVLSLIALIPIIMIVIWGALVEKFMGKKWEDRQKAYDGVYDFAQENFTGIRVIKAFVKGNQELHAFAKVARKSRDTNVSFVRLSVIFDIIISFIITCVLVIILGFGGWFVYSKVTHNPVVIFNHTINLTAGGLITFLGYFESLVWPMIAMGQIVTMHARAKTSLKRITRFLDTPEDVKDGPDAKDIGKVQGEVTFKDFSFIYPDSGKIYLKNISLTIKPGEKIGVIGKIGCGKSTLVNSLLRGYNVNKGQIFIDGMDIMDVTLSSLRNNIAYVPQDNFLFSDSIKNNIRFANIADETDSYVAAAQFSDVHSDIIDFKNAYDTVSGERGVTLSGGQKQRISIARAFYKHAPIMILDDSVSAVDVKTEETILHNIQSQREGKTTIVVASRVSTVSHFDRIIVLNEGELEAFDTPTNLLKISPTYKKMVELQRLEDEKEGGNA
ncbi:MAG: ABC transporter ATP-binding protein/permease [Bacilli bacterium]|nr:ABC transporter ATP-binding protein/permease [Bacilli bacterium]